jgi:hypothetical protein
MSWNIGTCYSIWTSYSFELIAALFAAWRYFFSIHLGEIWIGSWWQWRAAATKATTAMCEGSGG